MPFLTPGARFLGIDFALLWREFRQPWLRAHEWILFAWLTPQPLVRVLGAGGEESIWLGETRRIASPSRRVASFLAVEVPEEFVLRQTIAMPDIVDLDISNAAELGARSVNPFAPDDLAWGYRSGPVQAGARKVDIALVSRKQLALYLSKLSGVVSQRNVAPEFWVSGGSTAPIVLGGYGETRRALHVMRWRRTGLLLLAGGVCLSAAIAVTPVVQSVLRAREAAYALDEVTQRTAPQVAKREALLQAAEKLSTLGDIMEGRVDPLGVLDKLTQILPDDTALQSFKIQGSKVSIAGLTGNASALIQLLGEQSGFNDVRSPSPAVRAPGSTKEAFTLDFSLAPQLPGAAGKKAIIDTVDASPAIARDAGSSQAAVPVGAASSGSGPDARKPIPQQPPGGAVFGGTAAVFGGTAVAAGSSVRPASSPPSSRSPTPSGATSP